MFELSDTEYNAVLNLNADYKESFFKQKVSEHKIIYLIVDGEDLFLMSDKTEDSDGQKAVVLPVFCHDRFAQDFISKLENDNLKVVKITLDVYKQTLAPELAKENISLAIMPDDSKEFNIIDPTLDI